MSSFPKFSRFSTKTAEKLVGPKNPFDFRKGPETVVGFVSDG
jgi:hypothetical protein